MCIRDSMETLQDSHIFDFSRITGPIHDWLMGFLPSWATTTVECVAVGVGLLGLHYGGTQWWGLLSVPLLALYNGKKGTWNIGPLFYWYYPAHLVAIYGLSMLLERAAG